jgi:hypothetical protein
MMKVVHIGFPKTATTFLQRNVFPQLPARFRYFDERVSAGVFAPLIHEDDTIFDSPGHQQQFAAAWGNDSTLFSYESLTGLHYQTGFVNRTLIARRLRMLGFERVIITIRNQFDVLESAYKEYVKNGGVLKFADYAVFAPGKPRYLYPQYYDYQPIYRLYAEIFGKSNVLVLQHELLTEASFVRDLCRFLEVDELSVDSRVRVNTSLSAAKTEALRLINHLTYNSYRPSHLISKRFSTALFHRVLRKAPLANGSASCLDGRSRAEIAAYYHEANKRLAQDAGITLASSYP